MMNSNKATIIQLGLTIIMFLAAGWSYPQMPDYIASHWGGNGEVDGYMQKTWGLFSVPILTLGLLLLMKAIPMMDPLKKNIADFKTDFDRFVTVIIIFMMYLYGLTIVWNLGYRFEMLAWLMPAFAVLFYETGKLMDRAKPNWSIGVRTPWTLSNKTVWEKTNRMAARLFKAGAIVMLTGGLVFPKLAMLWIIGPVVIISVFLFAYSYIEFNHQK